MKTKAFKRLKFLLTIVMGCLLVMSLMALIEIHLTLATGYVFSLSAEGIYEYLTAYGKYNAIFAGAIGTITAYLGLLGFEDKIKQDRFVEWKTLLDDFLVGIETRNPVMKLIFLQERFCLFNFLYKSNFSISNKEQLNRIITDYFQEHIADFEKNDYKCEVFQEVYPDDKHSYSFEFFWRLLLCCVDRKVYPQCKNDLKELYLSYLPPKREINKELCNKLAERWFEYEKARRQEG